MVQFWLPSIGKPSLRERGDRIRSSERQLRNLLQKRLARLMTPVSEAQPAYGDLPGAIIEVARMLDRPGWRAYLVGGTLRDLLVGPGTRFRYLRPRDIDIIVCGATRDQLRKLLQKSLVLERLTRFGGLHLSKSLPTGTRLLFDIWTLADTWGFASRKIVPQIEEFPGTTFLNIDSCAIELQPPEGRPRAYFEQGFFESIANRMLNVNYAPNPYPYVCVARALLMAARLDFRMTRTLAEFILTNTSAGGISALIEAQQSHYGMVRSDASELKKWLDGIHRQFESRRSTIRVAVSRARRLQLWRDYPAGDAPLRKPRRRSLVPA